MSTPFTSILADTLSYPKILRETKFQLQEFPPSGSKAMKVEERKKERKKKERKPVRTMVSIYA